jgi:hypothetical protein
MRSDLPASASRSFTFIVNVPYLHLREDTLLISLLVLVAGEPFDNVIRFIFEVGHPLLDFPAYLIDLTLSFGLIIAGHIANGGLHGTFGFVNVPSNAIFGAVSHSELLFS